MCVRRVQLLVGMQSALLSRLTPGDGTGADVVTVLRNAVFSALDNREKGASRCDWTHSPSRSTRDALSCTGPVGVERVFYASVIESTRCLLLRSCVAADRDVPGKDAQAAVPGSPRRTAAVGARYDLPAAPMPCVAAAAFLSVTSTWLLRQRR